MYSVVSFSNKTERNNEPQTISREMPGNSSMAENPKFQMDNIKMAKINIQEYNLRKKQNKIDEEEKKELELMNKKESILKLIVKMRNKETSEQREDRIKELKKIIILHFQ